MTPPNAAPCTAETLYQAWAARQPGVPRPFARLPRWTKQAWINRAETSEAPAPPAEPPPPAPGCDWPLWNSARQQVELCGCPAEPNRPYCAEHAARAASKPVA